MDTLVRGGTIVTCDARDRVLRGDLLIRGREIAELGRALGAGPARIVDASGCAVLPGFVQAHVHLCQALMRGMADDLPLLEWLRRRIWPLEAAHDARSIEASAELGLAEMMLAGTTTILDMGTTHEQDTVMDACARAGIRALSGKAMMDAGDGVPEALKETTRSSLEESERVAATWANRADGRIGYAWAPRFVLSCSEALVRGTVDRARERGEIIHTHAAEHPSERAAVREAHGEDDVAVLRRWGVSGPRAVLAHGVALTNDEARVIAEDGTRVVHCPSANLKLGSGIARVADLDRIGVQLGIGADGAPCNNNMDPWTELRHAALLASIRTGIGTLSARRALRLATIDGARALGMEGRTGSIERGKRADLVVVRLDRVRAEPAPDVYSRLVYALGASDVRHVFVDGVQVVKDAEHQHLDVERVKARARTQARRLVSRAAL